MKKIIFVCALMASLSACRSKENKASRVIEKPSVTDSVVVPAHAASEGLVSETYEGVLPAADCEGIRYNLVIQTSKDSIGGNGLYQLAMTYLGGDNGNDKTIKSKGKKITLHGTPENKKALVYRLLPYNGEKPIDFLVETDSTLALAGKNLKPAKSNLNYTLSKVKN